MGFAAVAPLDLLEACGIDDDQTEHTHTRETRSDVRKDRTETVEFGSEEHISLIERMHQDALNVANAATAEQTKRADAAEGKLSVVEKSLTEANDPARLDSMVSERTAILAVAKGVIGEKFDAAGKTNHAIMVEALTAQDPDFKADSPEGFVSGAFSFLSSKLADPNDTTGSSWDKGRRQDNSDAKKKADDLKLDTVEKKDAKFKEDTESAWQKPLAMSSAS